MAVDAQATYKQCRLRHDSGQEQQTWIPTTHAREGHVVKLKDSGSWKDGWRVVRVFDPIMTHEMLLDRSRDHANHRKATDI